MRCWCKFGRPQGEFRSRTRSSFYSSSNPGISNVTQQALPVQGKFIESKKWNLFTCFSTQKSSSFDSLHQAKESKEKHVESLKNSGNYVQVNGKELPEWVEAAHELGWSFWLGEQVEKNPQKALEWWEKSASEGHPNAQCQTGILYNLGTGTPRDEKKSIEWLTKSAEQNIAEAQYHLGLIFYQDPSSRSKGLHLLEKSAANQDPYALCFLANLSTDDHKAFQMMEQSAKLGFDQAQYHLGDFYLKGKGTPKDLQKGLDWWTEAANNANPDALFHLGQLYYTGDSILTTEANKTPKNANLACLMWEHAASQDHADAQYHLGLAYFDGEGVEKSEEKAIELWTKAAEQRHAEAQFNLGLYYENTEEQMDMGEYWMLQSAKNGFKAAEEWLLKSK